MLWSTAMGAPCLSNPIPPTSRTATAVLRCCKSRAPSSRSFAWSGPTAATTPNASQAPPMFALRSSAKSQIKSASSSCHAAGWLSSSSLGCYWIRLVEVTHDRFGTGFWVVASSVR